MPKSTAKKLGGQSGRIRAACSTVGTGTYIEYNKTLGDGRFRKCIQQGCTYGI